jgi:DNA-binding NarL/FixJ family response regulator
LGFVEDAHNKDYMRILLAVSPIMYRETIAHVLRTNRPNVEVHLTGPEDLDREASSFGPDLIVCSDDAPGVRGVSVPSWVVIRYHDTMSSSVLLDGQDPRLIQDITLEDLLGVIDETQRLVT